jgi:hypothetical protein
VDDRTSLFGRRVWWCGSVGVYERAADGAVVCRESWKYEKRQLVVDSEGEGEGEGDDHKR